MYCGMALALGANPFREAGIMSEYPVRSRPVRAKHTSGFCDLCGEKIVRGQKIVKSIASDFWVHHDCALEDVIEPEETER